MFKTLTHTYARTQAHAHERTHARVCVLKGTTTPTFQRIEKKHFWTVLFNHIVVQNRAFNNIEHIAI